MFVYSFQPQNDLNCRPDQKFRRIHMSRATKKSKSSTIGELREICLAAARVCGWKGDSSVSVAVNAEQAAMIVLSDERRLELQEKLKRVQALQNKDELAAQPQPQPAVPEPEQPKELQAAPATDHDTWQQSYDAWKHEQLEQMQPPEGWHHVEPWD